MSNYFNHYSTALKSNFMLVIIACMLLILTFFIWAGVPIFIVGGAVNKLTTNPFLTYLSVSLSGGIIFSLYFLPINLKVAKEIAATEKISSLNSFLRLEAVWIVVFTAIWLIVLTAVLY